MEIPNSEPQIPGKDQTPNSKREGPCRFGILIFAFGLGFGISDFAAALPR